ncbi:MAG: succinylglutamate desuccinylase/aspartoacylase family protein [Firmicutes bacterium]|jgi:predicted deacylase|nr:succinylglutamate desuccinylase/aspartoacylase family protein [Bacillota bacterium]
MSNKTWLTRARLAIVVVWLAVVVPGALQLYEHRHFREPVVLGPGVTEVKKLGDYSPAVRGTVNDCNVYVLDSGVPGGTMLVLGSSHPEEPGAVLSAILIVEQARPTAGRILVVPRANRSASTVTRPGDAYPQFFTIETEWGERRFRMGDRWANPLDSWPDPEVYVHYPSRQMLAYMDVRNLNRAWPGRESGLIVERTTFALTELIKKEKVDVVIDLHEAELEYSVISTIVAHQRAADVAAMVSMMLSSMEFKIGVEYSPEKLHGLSHRELGDYTDALVFEPETPEPFLDRVRGVTDERLLLEGKDEFVMAAGRRGLLYEKIDESGWPIEVRVGRHNSTIAKIAEMYTSFYTERPILLEGLPLYSELVASGVGKYLADPEAVPSERVAYD